MISQRFVNVFADFYDEQRYFRTIAGLSDYYANHGQTISLTKSISKTVSVTKACTVEANVGINLSLITMGGKAQGSQSITVSYTHSQTNTVIYDLSLFPECDFIRIGYNGYFYKGNAIKYGYYLFQGWKKLGTYEFYRYTVNEAADPKAIVLQYYNMQTE